MSNNFSFKFEQKTIKVIFISLVMTIFISTIVTIIKDKNFIVATVNEEPISYKEFTLKLADNRAMISSYFNQKYNISYSEDFWTSQFNDEVPIEILKETTLRQLVNIKIEQQLAVKKGLLEDLSYSSFVNKLKIENRNRKKAIDNNEPIYGPEQYGEHQYFSYLHSIMLIDLKRILGENELAPTEQELKTLYDNTKKSLYKKKDYIKFKKISMVLINDEVELDVFNISKEIMNQIQVKLNNGVSFEAVVKNYKNKTPMDIEYNEYVFDENTVGTKEMQDSILYKQVVTANLGEVSPIIDEGNVLTLIKVTEKKDNGYISYGIARESLKLLYIDENYEKYINKLIKEAKVIINYKIFDQIDHNYLNN